ncbi:MAG: type II toxin-antitoxin system VapC family toxin [Sulfuricellaceae bacterium]|nr:type II toxin-antitoxin system VapC family toxin [Sulfuricellaceae bacterium]
MKRFVLDNSVVMAWYFEDEASDFTSAVLESLAESEALVPSIWPLEVANVLLVGERRGRSTEARSGRFIALLDTLPIRVDGATAQHALAGILSLAREHRLSAYDAAYLELAMREGVAMATQDQALRRAATACGVGLVGI